MSNTSKSGKTMRRRYSEEFKRDAVELVTQQGYSLAEAARSLGVHPNQIRYWKDKLGKAKIQNKTQPCQNLNEPSYTGCGKRTASCG